MSTHLTAVERFCFLGEEIGDVAAAMRPGPEVTAEAALADYRQTVRQANEVIAAWDDLGRSGPRPARSGSTTTRGWTLVHMIEETGRHAGHADIIREQIDGAVGR